MKQSKINKTGLFSRIDFFSSSTELRNTNESFTFSDGNNASTMSMKDSHVKYGKQKLKILHTVASATSNSQVN